MSDISFTSQIVPMRLSDFSRYVAAFNRDGFVDYPWTISTSRVACDVFTNCVNDCTSCLITNGEKALLMHLNPEIDANHNIRKVEQFISNNINLKDKNLQALLLGSQPYDRSLKIFNGFKNFLEKLNIPTTILQTGKEGTHLAYRTCKDEIYVSNYYIDTALLIGRNKNEALEFGFENVKIADCDRV